MAHEASTCKPKQVLPIPELLEVAASVGPIRGIAQTMNRFGEAAGQGDCEEPANLQWNRQSYGLRTVTRKDPVSTLPSSRVATRERL